MDQWERDVQLFIDCSLVNLFNKISSIVLDWVFQREGSLMAQYNGSKWGVAGFDAQCLTGNWQSFPNY